MTVDVRVGDRTATAVAPRRPLGTRRAGRDRLSLPLTHRLLGRLVGAERPSVSHALARLADAGLVTGRAGELHLRGMLDEHLAWLARGLSGSRCA
jgi:CRP-like cAMP-binding protein